MEGGGVLKGHKHTQVFYYVVIRRYHCVPVSGESILPHSAW